MSGVKRSIFGITAAVGMLVLPTAVLAQTDDLPRILSEQELADARGGFVIAGLELSLGAELRTYLGGELAMRTVVNWNDDGPQSEQWVSALLEPTTAASLGNSLFANGNLRLNLNGQNVFLANDGQTALLQPVDGRLQNMVFNTANGIDLRQEADISLAVSNYQTFREAMAPAILMSGLGEAISQTAIGATSP